MPREEDCGDLDFFCCRRNYMGLQYLSEHRLCNGCEYEVLDTFVGTESKVEKKLWFCKFLTRPDYA